jgi:hypothetical protein
MNQPDNEDEFSEEFMHEDATPSREELAVWLSEFMSQSQRAQLLYRTNFCSLAVNKVHAEFGIEGLCDLMLAIDKRAGWISDIIIEDADIQDAMFNTHGVFDDKAIIKARVSDEMIELNKKIWRLRRKYARLIAEEIIRNGTENGTESQVPEVS